MIFFVKKYFLIWKLNEMGKIKKQRESSSPSSTSTVSSSSSRLSSSQSRSETSSTKKSSDRVQGGGMIPMTMRDSFFDDPFFKDTWEEVEKSQREFFETSRKQFEKYFKTNFDFSKKGETVKLPNLRFLM